MMCNLFKEIKIIDCCWIFFSGKLSKRKQMQRVDRIVSIFFLFSQRKNLNPNWAHEK